MKQLTILGATGSIGASTLEVVSLHPERFKVFALTAWRDVAAMRRLCLQYQPRYAVMRDAAAAQLLKTDLADSRTEVLSGEESLSLVAMDSEVDIVVAAIVGASGLRPTIAAANAGKHILLANKEVLVMAGTLFMQAVTQGGATLLPIDSEHNAIFQVLPSADQMGAVRRILLTASGGPFRTSRWEDMRSITPEQALQHPNWRMGTKVSIDSATLMNKGLEVIEAQALFGVATEQIEVLIHPQSIVHSLVEYVDGSVLAQLSNPDMRVPIAYGLSYPERVHSGAMFLDLAQTCRLDFSAPDLERFPCLSLAYQALRLGGTAPAILNASNEIAVQAFVNKRIAFLDIFITIQRVLESSQIEPVSSLEQLIAIDSATRSRAESALPC